MTECSGLVFRLRSDMDLVVFNKSVMPLCSLLRLLAVDHGLGEVDVESHLVTQQHHPAQAGQEIV